MNPNKTPAVTDILLRNQKALCSFLPSFQVQTKRGATAHPPPPHTTPLSLFAIHMWCNGCALTHTQDNRLDPDDPFKGEVEMVIRAIETMVRG